jgi:hypothetical protein
LVEVLVGLQRVAVADHVRPQGVPGVIAPDNCSRTARACCMRARSGRVLGHYRRRLPGGAVRPCLISGRRQVRQDVASRESAAPAPWRRLAAENLVPTSSRSSRHCPTCFVSLARLVGLTETENQAKYGRGAADGQASECRCGVTSLAVEDGETEHRGDDHDRHKHGQ